MRNLVFIFSVLLLVSCTSNKIAFAQTILENNIINTPFLQTIASPEKALLSWVLFAYGNECTANSKKSKCKILKLLNIDNECDKKQLFFLNKWFGKNILMQFKLRKCPNLPHKFAIQNNIKKIVLKRRSDTLRVTIKVGGMNTVQEKFWTIEKTESFLLKNNTLIKIND